MVELSSKYSFSRSFHLFHSFKFLSCVLQAILIVSVEQMGIHCLLITFVAVPCWNVSTCLNEFIYLSLSEAKDFPFSLIKKKGEVPYKIA